MKYVRSEGERAVQLKAYWLVLGERGSFGFKRMYAIVFFFAVLLQSRNKGNELFRSDNQNYPFPSPPYS